MPNILNIARTGLDAFRHGLEITANNIANKSSAGYSRQTLLLNSLPSQRVMNGFIGNGVKTGAIIRSSDQFAVQHVRTTLTAKTQYETFYNQAREVDKLLSQEGTSISASMQKFFNSLSKLNETPESIAARGVVLNQSRLFVDQFNTMQQRLDETKQTNFSQLTEAVNQINQITKNIADLNGRLSSLVDAPELLDQRDQLLEELSKYTDVLVSEDPNSGITVGIASGEVLVSGAVQKDLVVVQGLNGQSGTRIAIQNGTGYIDVTRSMDSGMTGGFLDFENNIVTTASQLLGQMAIGLASAFNQQQALGMDMNNALGNPFFTDFNTMAMQLARANAASTNTGTGVLSVDISNIDQTKVSDYELIVSNAASGQVRVLRKSDGQSFNMTLTNTPPTPPAGQITLDGLTITVDDTTHLNDNDRFTLEPTKGAAGSLALLINDPRQIAYAAPVRTQAALTNLGNGTLVLGDMFNTTNVAKDFRIDFISDTQYNLVNVTDSVTTGPFTFTPNTNNTIMIPDSVTPSYSVVLSGVVRSGDQFTMAYNTDGFGDNRNGLKMANIQNSKLFEGGSESLGDRYADLVAYVGSKTNQAQSRADIADILYKDAVDFKEGIAGVNLDEEAANLLHFQQSYQAAGKLLSVANDMINFLFSVMR